MRAHFGLPSVTAEDLEGKPPIHVHFEIPYFTVSGVQVWWLYFMHLVNIYTQTNVTYNFWLLYFKCTKVASLACSHNFNFTWFTSTFEATSLLIGSLPENHREEWLPGFTLGEVHHAERWLPTPHTMNPAGTKPVNSLDSICNHQLLIDIYVRLILASIDNKMITTMSFVILYLQLTEDFSVNQI